MARLKGLIRKLVETYGPAGSEDHIREVIEAEVAPYVDDLRVDAIGNLICKVGPRGNPPEEPKRIMVSAHMDEIGLVVSFIDDKGFLRFSPAGGFVPHTLVGERVTFANGTTGVIGSEKVDDIKDIKIEKLFIDIGARDRADAESRVRIGDAAGYRHDFVDLGERMVAKSMDDRVGCAVAIEAMKRIRPAVAEVYVVFTVQEELGLRGARTSAYGINPHVGLAVDVTTWGDTPEAAPMPVSLGKGVAIKAKDTSVVVHPGVKNFLIGLAERNGIPYQIEVLDRGGTDAGAIHLTREGVPSGAISIPCRYVHSSSEMVDAGDVQAAIRLLSGALDELASPTGGGIL
ncbi:MAG: M42 family metallopeptidase [Firmicutes bacterium]|jgi:endoglucanase|nr:M42 family metallopeptidase [Bacillota bacterium]